MTARCPTCALRPALGGGGRPGFRFPFLGVEKKVCDSGTKHGADGPRRGQTLREAAVSGEHSLGVGRGGGGRPPCLEDQGPPAFPPGPGHLPWDPALGPPTLSAPSGWGREDRNAPCQPRVQKPQLRPRRLVTPRVLHRTVGGRLCVLPALSGPALRTKASNTHGGWRSPRTVSFKAERGTAGHAESSRPHGRSPVSPVTLSANFFFPRMGK